ncbi:MAG: hypothetical protein DRH33_04090 [Candidatus Nealsonbacteria bacterium]|nr:MAG: hypothetical protein DRH33_04090 [Candidatus Nealsonbacteria bacterium]
MDRKKITEAIKERIKEVIKENVVEQDNQGYQDIGMINEEGLKRIVEEMADYLVGVVEGTIDTLKLQGKMKEAIEGRIREAINASEKRRREMKKVMDIYRKNWTKIGRTGKGEGIYYNKITKKVAIEKDYSYLVEPGEDK